MRSGAEASLASTVSGLSGEQQRYLRDLEAKRRQMLAVRRGNAAAPEPFDAEREAKLRELRAAGRLNAAQELFLRLCGPAEVDRQHALLLFFGEVYAGIIVPSLRSLVHERRVQKLITRAILRAHRRVWDRTNARQGRQFPRRPVRRQRASRRRRSARRPARSTSGSASDGPSEPPPTVACSLSASGGAS